MKKITASILTLAFTASAAFAGNSHMNHGNMNNSNNMNGIHHNMQGMDHSKMQHNMNGMNHGGMMKNSQESERIKNYKKHLKILESYQHNDNY